MEKCTLAADMACFQFGERRQVPSRKGGTREVGEYALHLQCPWRIVKDDKIIMAALDVYHCTQGHEETDNPDFDSQRDGTLLGNRIETFFAENSQTYRVERVQAANAGAVQMSLEGGFYLEFSPPTRSPASTGGYLSLAKTNRTS